jgi:putative ABC transport system permease protein
VGGTVRSGEWLNAATSEFPTVVLGHTAAERLGVITPGTQIWLGEHYFTMIDILDPVPSAPTLDTSALIGEKIATTLLNGDGRPTTIDERSADHAVTEIRTMLRRAANPQAPNEVEVTRPSDTLAAKNAADEAFTSLLVGLRSVALLVGRIGIANTMVIPVLERRREIGLRKALGATRPHIRSQFLTEALLLSALGSITGALLGTGVTAIFAAASGWPVVIPPLVLAASIGATLIIGAIAGLYPAIHAAMTPPPTSALGG